MTLYMPRSAREHIWAIPKGPKPVETGRILITGKHVIAETTDIDILESQTFLSVQKGAA